MIIEPLPGEVWRRSHIPGIEVSSMGRVLKPDFGILKPSVASDGAMQIVVRVRDIPNTFRVARLVGVSFNKDYRPHLYVWHIDRNKSNCHADNLEWLERSVLMRRINEEKNLLTKRRNVKASRKSRV
jgi:hypothetical protein